MILMKLVLLVLVILAMGYPVSSVCPARELIKPCFCEDEGIVCTRNVAIDLVKMFETLDKNLTKTEKHFKRFELSNDFITELKDKTFKDITFDEILITKCNNLVKIETNAFEGTDLVTKELTISVNPKLNMDKSIFEILSSFLNVQTIFISDFGINEIPSNAFELINGHQKYLTHLSFYQKLTKIGSNAFSKLPSLKSLSFYLTNFQTIPAYAFQFDEHAATPFQLGFYLSLNISAFNEKSLLFIGRPTRFYLEDVQGVTYLDEKVFLPFLLDNQNNTIEVNWANSKQSIFDCSDCRNYWIKKNQNITERVSVNCSNQKKFNDPDNFKNCHFEFDN